ncbi:MAG: hypothetical protein QNJ67_02875 [Kiloniellales bacterium]|nr:hypothetical protein [Kiloniellales bacterium]
MYQQFDEGTLTRGADGALYLLRPGSCVRVEGQTESGNTELSPWVDEGAETHADCQSARVLVDPGCVEPIEASDDPGDNSSAMVLINPGDVRSARVLVDPGDMGSARVLVDPGDGVSARVLIDPGSASLN